MPTNHRKLFPGIICPVQGTNMNNQKRPPENREFKPRPPRWSSYWYLPIMLLILWGWQSAVLQFAYKNIHYSEFKDYVRKGEIAECTIKETTIEGTIKPKTSPQSDTNAVAQKVERDVLTAPISEQPTTNAPASANPQTK